MKTPYELVDNKIIPLRPQDPQPAIITCIVAGHINTAPTASARPPCPSPYAPSAQAVAVNTTLSALKAKGLLHTVQQGQFKDQNSSAFGAHTWPRTVVFRDQ